MRKPDPKIYFENSWSAEFKAREHNLSRGDRPLRHRKRKRTKHRNCQNCGKPFDTLRNRQRYCSTACVQAGKIARRRERDITKHYARNARYIVARAGYKLCEHCHANTFPAWREGYKYCSRRCSELAAYERRKTKLAQGTRDHRETVRDPDP